MRLVDDDGVVVGDHRHALDGVDRQQRVVGDDQVGAVCLLARHLDEALLTERAPGCAQALAVVDRDLTPLPVGVPGRVVPLARTSRLGLPLGPRPQVEHLLGHRALRYLDQRALLVGHTLADAVQADVVRAAFQDGVRRVDGVLELARADRLDQPGDVALDELVLQGEGRGRDDHPPVVQQGRDEVTERLAGAGAGLDEQVLLAFERVGHRLGHRHLARPFLASERFDRRGQHAAHGGVGGVVGHRATLCPGVDTRRPALTGLDTGSLALARLDQRTLAGARPARPAELSLALARLDQRTLAGARPARPTNSRWRSPGSTNELSLALARLDQRTLAGARPARPTNSRWRSPGSTNELSLALARPDHTNSRWRSPGPTNELSLALARPDQRTLAGARPARPTNSRWRSPGPTNGTLAGARPARPTNSRWSSRPRGTSGRVETTGRTHP